MITREDWLLSAAEIMRSTLFKPHGYTVPKVRISVGIPYGSKGLKAIGQHWSPKASDDNVGTVFISPIIDDASRALDILVHELVHAAVGVEHGHDKVFGACARTVGLDGHLTATIAGNELKLFLNTLVAMIGPYPHAKLNIHGITIQVPDPKDPTKTKTIEKYRPWKKQGTRMIKQFCLDCGYTVRSSQKWIDVYGPVLCPCNSNPMELK